MKKVIIFFLLACIGITTEVFFTAIKQMVISEQIDWSLKGNSYIWMFPIYGSASFLFPIIMGWVEKYHVLIRISAYACGILLVEFVAGAILDFLTGSCPWEYKTRLHFMGYIRFDYFPFWALFGYCLENTINFLNKNFADSISSKNHK